MTGGGALSGQVVLLAGASSGMGRALARQAAAAGATLALLARRPEALEVVAAEARAAGAGGVLPVPADAADPAAVQAAVDRVLAGFGRIDVLVNTVGTNLARRALDELTPESWRGMVAANLDAAFHLTRSAVPAMRRGGRRLILHVSSVAARRADRSGLAYQATKAGVVALAQATMEEERENGFRVTVLLPGMTDTPLLDRRPTPPTPEMRRAALQPDDVAAACMLVMGMPERVHVAEILLQPART